MVISFILFEDIIILYSEEKMIYLIHLPGSLVAVSGIVKGVHVYLQHNLTGAPLNTGAEHCDHLNLVIDILTPLFRLADLENIFNNGCQYTCDVKCADCM